MSSDGILALQSWFNTFWVRSSKMIENNIGITVDW